MAALLVLLGVALLGGAWWHAHWRANQARLLRRAVVMDPAAWLTVDVPAAWPTALLAGLGVMALVGAAAVSVAVYVARAD